MLSGYVISNLSMGIIHTIHGHDTHCIINTFRCNNIIIMLTKQFLNLDGHGTVDIKLSQ